MTIAPPTPFAYLRPAPWAAAYVRASANDINALGAAFAAGAALAVLDFTVRQNAPFAGALRSRLALHAATAGLRHADETSLRDALALTQPGGDPGPAGRVYRAWRALAQGGRLIEITAGLGAPDPAALAALFERSAKSASPAPIAAAAAASAVATLYPRAAPLAHAIADLVLATKLGWLAPVPLLASEIARTKARPGDADWSTACCAAYARAATRACDLHADLAHAAARLAAVAPKLRAKGAAAALTAVLDDDAVSSSRPIAGLSDRGLRRLFDRLVDLGAVRELTGRATFRLYGL